MVLKRSSRPRGIGETKTAGAGLLCRLRHPHHEIHVGARGVFRAHAYVAVEIARQSDATFNLLQDPLARAAQLVLEMQVGDRHGQVDEIHAALRGRMQVLFAHAPPNHELRGQLQGDDGLDDFSLFGAHHRNADFHLAHAGGGERLCDRQLLLGAEGDTGGLLTVA